jgi:tetratricopeptide (TPR) repeat protein
MYRRYFFAAVFFAGLISSVYSAVPGDHAGLNRKGLEQLEQNSPGRAAVFFLRAISADPSRKHYYNNLGSAYIRMGEYAKAEENLKKALALDANYARALSNMSVALFHLRRYRESYHYYQLAKKADSGYAGERFEKKKVASFIRKLSASRPSDDELKKINEYMDSGKDGEGE